MNNKKIIIFMPSIEGGGVEKNLFIIANFLGDVFKNVNILTSSKSYNNKFKNIAIINPLFDFEKNKLRLMKYIVCLITLLRIILLNKNILVFSFQANLYCIILCKLFGCKIIIRPNSSPSGWSQNKLKFFFYKKIFNLADKIIVNSYQLKNEFKKKFDVYAVCIYNPLNKNEIIRKSKIKIKKIFKKKKSLKIINIGRLVDQKDQLTILKALNLIKNKVDFEFLIIGKGILKEKLSKFIRKHNLNNIIKIINFKKNPYPYIKQSNIFLLSSKFEGLPNVLLEAICLNKLVISTNCPTGPKEILDNGKGGFLYNVGNYNQLSKIILTIKNKKKIIIKKKKHAYSMLFRFDFEENLNRYYKTIKKVFQL